MLMSFVNPGVGETRARPSLPASMFSSEDLPTFERPMKANSGRDSSGHESRSGALQSKMADEMFTFGNLPSIVAANRLNDTTNFKCGKTGGLGRVVRNFQVCETAVPQ